MNILILHMHTVQECCNTTHSPELKNLLLLYLKLVSLIINDEIFINWMNGFHCAL